MKSTKFQIDYISKQGEDGLIIVKYLSGEKGFEITSESKLENVPLAVYLEMPRKVDEEGNLMLDSFILKLKSKSDLEKFKVGQIVKLKK